MDGKIAIYEKSHWHLLRCGNMIGLRFVVFFSIIWTVVLVVIADVFISR